VPPRLPHASATASTSPCAHVGAEWQFLTPMILSQGPRMVIAIDVRCLPLETVRGNDQVDHSRSPEPPRATKGHEGPRAIARRPQSPRRPPWPRATTSHRATFFSSPLLSLPVSKRPSGKDRARASGLWAAGRRPVSCAPDLPCMPPRAGHGPTRRPHPGPAISRAPRSSCLRMEASQHLSATHQLEFGRFDAVRWSYQLTSRSIAARGRSRGRDVDGGSARDLRAAACR
jgi:hypothetical protein